MEFGRRDLSIPKGSCVCEFSAVLNHHEDISQGIKKLWRPKGYQRYTARSAAGSATGGVGAYLGAFCFFLPNGAIHWIGFLILIFPAYQEDRRRLVLGNSLFLI